MKKFTFLILVVLIGCGIGFSQTAQKADELFQNKQYNEAFEAYKNLLKKQPKSTLFLYRYARCADEIGQKQIASEHFLLAGEKYPLRNFYLAEIYFDEYQFDNALEYYNKYLLAINEDNEKYEYVNNQITTAQKGSRYLKRVEDIQIVDSIRILKSNFLNEYNLSEESGSLTYSDHAVCYTNQRGERKIKAAISQDASNNIDSINHSIFNLVICQKLMDEFSECDTLKDGINSNYNENFPFLLSDGITLYFASDRPEGLGKYDIYMTRYNSVTDSYLTPENIGMPFNSPANDYMLAIDETQNIGYFLTDRRCSPDSAMLYKFIPNNSTQIIRNQSEEYIRLAAQMKAYRTTNRVQPLVANVNKQETKNSQLQKTIFFVLADTIAYHSLSEFRSIDAKILYEECMELETQQNEERNQLLSMRKAYREASDEEKTTMKAAIIQLEKKCRAHKGEMLAALNKVRQIEIKTY